eukprot:110085_1
MRHSVRVVKPAISLSTHLQYHQFSTTSKCIGTVVKLDGDGAGPELMESTKLIVDETLKYFGNKHINWIDMPFGYDLFLSKGYQMNNDHIKEFKKHKTILKGPIEIPSIDTSSYVKDLDLRDFNLDLNINTFSSPILALRKIFDLYINLRPTISCEIKNFKASNFENINIICVRENTEDLYTEEEIIKDNGNTVELVKRITKKSSKRIAEFCKNYCITNNRNKLGVVTREDITPLADRLYLKYHREIFKDSHKKYNIEYNEYLANDLLYRLMIDHSQFDVLSCPNMYGDLISDLLGGMIGSLGLMPSSQFGDDNYALFEPVHGAAPDIARQNIINPISMWRTANMMLDHLGEGYIVDVIESGIKQLLVEGKFTPDLGGSLSTTQMTDELLTCIENTSSKHI